MTWRHDGPLTAFALASLQISAIDTWHQERRAFESSLTASSGGVTSQVDAVRRLAVLRRQHEGMVERTRQHLSARVRIGNTVARTRVMLIDRNAWFVDKVCAGGLTAQVDYADRVETMLTADARETRTSTPPSDLTAFRSSRSTPPRPTTPTQDMT